MSQRATLSSEQESQSKAVCREAYIRQWYALNPLHHTCWNVLILNKNDMTICGHSCGAELGEKALGLRGFMEEALPLCRGGKWKIACEV